MTTTLMVICVTCTIILTVLFIWLQISMYNFRKFCKKHKKESAERLAEWDRRFSASAFMGALDRYLKIVESGGDLAPANTKEMAGDIKTILKEYVEKQ